MTVGPNPDAPSGANCAEIEEASRPRRRMLNANTALALGSLLFFSLILEATARFFVAYHPSWGHWQVTWPRLADPNNIWWDVDAELFWRLKPNSKRHETNKYGCRGTDFPVEKPPGVRRVLSIGDSSAFGAAKPNLRAEQTYAARLESLLNTHDATCRWHVINAGVPGYTSLQGLRYLPRLERFKPDAIVVYFGRNDRILEPYSDADRPVGNAALGNFVLSVLGRSKFCVCFGNVLIRGKTIFMGRAELPPESEYVPRVSPAEFQQNLRQIAQIGREWEAPVFIMPYVQHDGKGNLYCLDQFLRYDVGGVHIVDFFGRWQAYLDSTGEGPEAIMADTIHPNVIGHQLIAQALFEAFMDQALVEAD